MIKKLKVGVLGATGIVGQRYIELLNNHPWFHVTYVAASEKSAEKPYKQAVAGRWHMTKEVPDNVASLRIMTVENIKTAKRNCDFVFSALDSKTALEFEEKYASYGIPVISNASAHRWTKDVPMLIPEINHQHLKIIPNQQKNRGWKRGFIVVKPNCSLQSYLTPLSALHNIFRIRKVVITTMQSVSGAGYPGVASFDILDNIVPFIEDEEEKTEQEPLKIFGKIQGKEIINDNNIKISAHCNRVPTIDGHMVCVSVKFEKRPEKQEIIKIWKKFKSLPQKLKLPFAPIRPIIYMEEVNRPQTRFDRDADKGMAVIVGRLRKCYVLDYRFVGLSHNTIRGAAGGGILNAELLYKMGYLTSK